MFCPLCQAEYREGFTECSDCGVPLVDQLLSASEPRADVEDTLPGVVLWHGPDPVLFSRITHDLMDAGIPFHSMMEMDEKHMPMFPVAMQYGKRGFKLFVHHTDLERAQGLLPASAKQRADNYSDPEPDSIEPPLPSVPHDFDEGQATAAIWQGNDRLLSQAIQDGLASNGIGSIRFAVEVGKEEILVMPRDVSQAESLVRQVLEGEVPPELNSIDGPEPL